MLNPNSLEVLTRREGRAGRSPTCAPETRLQFERTGYFVADWHDARAGRPVFNRTVGLRDTWAKIEKAS